MWNMMVMKTVSAEQQSFQKETQVLVYMYRRDVESYGSHENVRRNLAFHSDY